MSLSFALCMLSPFLPSYSINRSLSLTSPHIFMSVDDDWLTDDYSLPGFNRLRMHTQLKALPSSNTEHQYSNPAIQQLAATTCVGQQGTIITKANNNNNKTIVNANHHIPVAFVEFSDVQSAGRAMQMLQGKFLLSSDRGAIRIEYAKSSSSLSSSSVTTNFPYSFATTTANTAILNGRPH